MTDKTLAQIEAKLKVKLPAQYGEVIRRLAELQAAAQFDDELSGFFLTAEDVITYNKLERRPDSGTGYAFPKWWKTFVLIGTNGAGDYYCLRLDNQPGLWLIGSDCGDEPTLMAADVAEYLAERIQECRAEMELDEEREQRRHEVARIAPGEPAPAAPESAVPQYEPVLPGDDFTWDFTCAHPTIPGAELKERLHVLGTAAGGNLDDASILAFADWLETKGDDRNARYVRARCGLDEKSPGADYPDLIEQLLENQPDNAVAQAYRYDFPGFRLPYALGEAENWWAQHRDGLQCGLPTFVELKQEPTPDDFLVEMGQIIKRIEMLARQTSVRGLSLGYYCPLAVLDSPGASPLRRLALESVGMPNKVSGTIESLINSRLAPALDRLDLVGGIHSDPDAQALAAAPFERLRRLEVHGTVPVGCSPSAVQKLTGAPWFRRLQHLLIGFTKTCCEAGLLGLGGMPELHTLCLWVPAQKMMPAFAQMEPLPALRRLLVIHAEDLSGKNMAAFTQLQAPQLLELWLRNAKLKSTDLRTLIAAPLFDNLRVLSLDDAHADKKGLEALAASACAARLRILRIHSGTGGGKLVGCFRSLADTALARPDAFPQLTTLKLSYPFARAARQDTAQLLQGLTTPSLRHLVLEECSGDAACLQAILDNPACANLRRLVLSDRETTLGAADARRLFESGKLPELVEVQLGRERFHADQA
ncbi:MAG: SMI1/KNR4 family protein [Gemmataceae bacterium]